MIDWKKLSFAWYEMALLFASEKLNFDFTLILLESSFTTKSKENIEYAITKAKGISSSAIIRQSNTDQKQAILL